TLSVMPCCEHGKHATYAQVTRIAIRKWAAVTKNNYNGAIRMNKNQSSIGNNSRFKGKKVLRFLATIGLAAAMTGCGKLGYLLSNDRVVDADNNDVLFIGDSIFALSGKIQDNLEAKAGQTFRRYTISGAQLVGGFVAPSVPEQFAMAKAD